MKSREKFPGRNGQLTNCLNGDRVLHITPPSQPIPRKITIGKTFRARVYHNGQPTPNIGTPTCSRCLEKGHHVSNCTNAMKCQLCRKDGHVRSECPEGHRTVGGRGAMPADEARIPGPRETPDETNRDGRGVRNNESCDSSRRQTSLADYLPKHVNTLSGNKSRKLLTWTQHPKASIVQLPPLRRWNSAARAIAIILSTDIQVASEAECSSTSSSESDSEQTMTPPEALTPPKAKNDKRKSKIRNMKSSKKKWVVKY